MNILPLSIQRLLVFIQTSIVYVNLFERKSHALILLNFILIGADERTKKELHQLKSEKFIENATYSIDKA
jgi:hypothetical protein